MKFVQHQNRFDTDPHSNNIYKSKLSHAIMKVLVITILYQRILNQTNKQFIEMLELMLKKKSYGNIIHNREIYATPLNKKFIKKRKRK